MTGALANRTLVTSLAMMLAWASAGRAETMATNVLPNTAFATRIQRPLLRSAASRASQNPSTATVRGRHQGLWTLIGAVGGGLGGFYLGAAIERKYIPCHCDDPGLQGAILGIPIGAAGGGIAGFFLSR